MPRTERTGNLLLARANMLVQRIAETPEVAQATKVVSRVVNNVLDTSARVMNDAYFEDWKPRKKS